MNKRWLIAIVPGNLAVPNMQVIGEYLRSVEKYPNPPAVNLTDVKMQFPDRTPIDRRHLVYSADGQCQAISA